MSEAQRGRNPVQPEEDVDLSSPNYCAVPDPEVATQLSNQSLLSLNPSTDSRLTQVPTQETQVSPKFKSEIKGIVGNPTYRDYSEISLKKPKSDPRGTQVQLKYNPNEPQGKAKSVGYPPGATPKRFPKRTMNGGIDSVF